MSDFNFQTQASNLAMAGTVNGVPYTDAQKAEMARCIVEKQQEFAIHNNVSAFVQANPNFLLDQRFPPISSKKYPKGDQPESWQQTQVEFLCTAYNAFKGRMTNARQIPEDEFDMFVSCGWLQHNEEVIAALSARNVQDSHRCNFITALILLCRVKEICETGDVDWTRIRLQYERAKNRIVYGADKQNGGNTFCAARKAMTTEQADEHCKDVSQFAVKLADELEPVMEQLDELDESALAKRLQTFHIIEWAQEPYQRKKLGVWIETMLLALMKHGDLVRLHESLPG
jgi:hypothetical protein